MGVIEAEPRRTWRKRDPPQAMRRDEGRPLFRGPIHIRGHELTVPMKLLRRVRIVVDVDDNALAFRQPKQGTRKLAIVECGRDCRIWSEFDQTGADTDRVVRYSVRDGFRRLRWGFLRVALVQRLSLRRREPAGGDCCDPSNPKEMTAIEDHGERCECE